MATCKACGAKIEWLMNDKGKWVPYDLNGVNHFNTCPDAKVFRGKHFTNDNTKDYTRMGVPKDQTQLNKWG